jgi:tetratricopeptide (TPR) repeat protein
MTWIRCCPRTCWPDSLPKSLESFIERKALLAELTTQLAPQRIDGLKGTVPTVLTAVGGLGGVGKTELAKYFLHHGPHRYTIRLWFSADDRNELIKEYRALGERLGLPLFEKARKEQRQATDDEVIQGVRDWLSEHPGWLAVYDNADGTQVNDLLPNGGHVLLTTRVGKAWEEFYRCRSAHLLTPIWVDTLEEGEAVEMLRVFSGLGDNFNEEDARRLSERLGCLALAVRQAAECIRLNNTCDTYTVGDYLEDYESTDKGEQLALLFTRFDDDDRQGISRRCVMTTWELSLQAIEKKAQQPGQQFLQHARGLLQAMSYCGPEAVPVEVAKQWLSKRCKKAQANQILHELNKQGLLPRDKETQTFTLHRVVRDVLQLMHQYPEGDSDKPLEFREREAMYCALADSLTDVYEDYLEQWNWENIENLKPHLKQVDEACRKLRETTIESKEIEEVPMPVELVMLQVDRLYNQPAINYLNIGLFGRLEDYGRCLSELEKVLLLAQSKNKKKTESIHLRALMNWLQSSLEHSSSVDETFAPRLKQAQDLLAGPISISPALLIVSRMIMAQMHERLGNRMASREEIQTVLQTLETLPVESLKFSLLVEVLSWVATAAGKRQDSTLLREVWQVVQAEAAGLNQTSEDGTNPLGSLLSRMASAASACQDSTLLGEVWQVVQAEAAGLNQTSEDGTNPLGSLLSRMASAASACQDSTLLGEVWQVVQAEAAELNQTSEYGENPLGSLLSEMATAASERQDSTLLGEVLQVVQAEAAGLNQTNRRGENPLGWLLGQMVTAASERQDSTLLREVLQVVQAEAAGLNQTGWLGANPLGSLLSQMATAAGACQDSTLLREVLQVVQAEAAGLKQTDWLGVNLLGCLLDQMATAAGACQDSTLLREVLQVVQAEVAGLNQTKEDGANLLGSLLGQMTTAAGACQDSMLLGEVWQVVQAEAAGLKQTDWLGVNLLGCLLGQMATTASERQDSTLLGEVWQVVQAEAAGLNQTSEDSTNPLGSLLDQMVTAAGACQDSTLLGEVLQVVQAEAAELNQTSEDGTNPLGSLLDQMAIAASERQDSTLLGEVLQVVQAKAAELNQINEDGENLLGCLLGEMVTAAGACQDSMLLEKVFQVVTTHNSVLKNAPRVYRELGDAYLIQGKVALAIKSYEQVKALDSTSLEVCHNLACCYHREDELAKAESTFQAGLALKTSAIHAAYGLFLFQQAGRELEVIKICEQALALSGDEGELCYDESEQKLIGEVLGEEVAKRGKIVLSAGVLSDFLLIQASTRCKKIKLAEESLNRLHVRVFESENSLYFSLLGHAYAFMGDTSEARAWFERVLNEEPGNKLATAQIEALLEVKDEVRGGAEQVGGADLSQVLCQPVGSSEEPSLERGRGENVRNLVSFFTTASHSLTPQDDVASSTTDTRLAR